MKKICSIVCIVCVMAGVLSACSKEAVIKNEIATKELTQDQQDIVDLLASDKREILLFDYKTEDAYQSMTVWVEIYENGELVDRQEGMNAYSDEARALDGQLAILVRHDSGVDWTFIASENDSRISQTCESMRIDHAGLARGYGPITNSVKIEQGKEIVLFTSIYSTGNISARGDLQEYIEAPDLLSGYPYAQMIKCKFE